MESVCSPKSRKTYTLVEVDRTAFAPNRVVRQAVASKKKPQQPQPSAWTRSRSASSRCSATNTDGTLRKVPTTEERLPLSFYSTFTSSQKKKKPQMSAWARSQTERIALPFRNYELDKGFVIRCKNTNSTKGSANLAAQPDRHDNGKMVEQSHFFERLSQPRATVVEEQTISRPGTATASVKKPVSSVTRHREKDSAPNHAPCDNGPQTKETSKCISGSSPLDRHSPAVFEAESASVVSHITLSSQDDPPPDQAYEPNRVCPPNQPNPTTSPTDCDSLCFLEEDAT